MAIEARLRNNPETGKTESWKDKQTGEQQNRNEWHRIVLFKQLSEIANFVSPICDLLYGLNFKFFWIAFSAHIDTFLIA